MNMTFKIFLPLLLVLTHVSALAPSARGQAADEKVPVRDKWAIVVGISNFSRPDIPTLKYASKDARDFYEYLTKEANFAPNHVRLLLNEKATRRRILAEVDNMFLGRVAKPDDLIVLFFSTHGSPSQLDKTGKNFIVAYDTEPNELFATGIEMQSITRDLRERVDAKRVLIVLDACHSGSVTPNAKGMQRVGNFDTEVLSIGAGQMIICSSQPDQQSWESKRYNNGVFTKNLLHALRTKGKDKPVDDAFTAATELVESEVQEDYAGARQTPVLKSKWTGEGLILSVKPNAAQAIPQSVLTELEPDSTSSHSTPVVQSTTHPADTKSGGGEASKFEKAKVLKLNVAYFSSEADPRRAYEAACQALATHKGDPEYCYRKAKVLIQLGRYGSAMQELKGAIIDNPNVAAYYLARAYCFHKMKQDGNAEADLRDAKFRDVFLPQTIEFED